jgi:hypothetical protein
VAERVSELRKQGRADPWSARQAAWSWIEELGKHARGDRADALAELQQLFACGEPATGVDGETEGMLVTCTMHPLADKVIGGITNVWMPWLGKKFDFQQQTGINTLTNSARWPAKLLWPLYSMHAAAGGRRAFEFSTYIEAGKLDPNVDVLVIDYESVESNPKLLIRQIRDELVEIAPGANLGKMLVTLPRRSQPFPALFFALRSEI